MSHQTNKNSVVDPWDSSGLVESKIHPVSTHKDYPHLVDLNAFMKLFASNESLTILDYGAGASPYKCYFPNSDYRRADITDAPSLQYKIKPDSTLSEADGMFDLIISTQVAEHVPNPDVYFKECYRLLKPGGRLILTTHGIWDEHGSPYDFQRWTDVGLSRDLKLAGFPPPEMFKLTCNMRAALVIFTRALYVATPPALGLPKLCFKVFRWFYSRMISRIYKISDHWFPVDTIVRSIEGDAATPTWYIVVAAVARK